MAIDINQDLDLDDRQGHVRGAKAMPAAARKSISFKQALSKDNALYSSIASYR